MAKGKGKEKGLEGSTRSVANKDVLQRLNFLYQASAFFTDLERTQIERKTSERSRSAKLATEKTESQAPENSEADLNEKDDSQRSNETVKTKKGENEEKNPDKGPSTMVKKKTKSPTTRTARKLSGHSTRLMKEMKEISKRGVVRMDPSIKRTVCKGCFALLIPGQTCRTRVKASKIHVHVIQIRCLQCGYSRNIPAPPQLDLPPERVSREELKRLEKEYRDRVRQKRKKNGAEQDRKTEEVANKAETITGRVQKSDNDSSDAMQVDSQQPLASTSKRASTSPTQRSTFSHDRESSSTLRVTIDIVNGQYKPFIDYGHGKTAFPDTKEELKTVDVPSLLELTDRAAMKLIKGERRRKRRRMEKKMADRKFKSSLGPTNGKEAKMKFPGFWEREERWGHSIWKGAERVG